MAELTPKLKAFVRAYTTNGGNGKQAAEEVGYCEKTAYRNLQKPEVQEALKEHEAKLDAKVEEKILCTVESLFDEIKDLQMKVDVEKNRGVQAKLLEMKGKLCGLFIDRQEVSMKPLRKLEVEIKE